MADPIVPPKPAPSLNIPNGKTVTVRVIDSTTTIHGSSSIFVKPLPDGFKSDVAIPAYSFLISHGDRHVLFDLGVRKDWWNLPPAISRDRVGPDKSFQVDVDKDVADILEEDPGRLGVKPDDIEAIVWSHHHFDHTGNPNRFPKTTGVVVGPGFKKALLPLYPENPQSSCRQDYVDGRNFREVDISSEGHGLKLGGYESYDYFGDGSFYLLSSPGHAPGHVCGLARVTDSPNSTFVFMGGDICHHCGEFRPSEFVPLPSEIRPSPIPKFSPGACPGAVLERLQRHGRADEPFFEPHEDASADIEETRRSLVKLREFDADPNVLVVFAHDASLRDRLPFYPKTINDWKTDDLSTRTRWQFVKDFSGCL